MGAIPPRAAPGRIRERYRSGRSRYRGWEGSAPTTTCARGRSEDPAVTSRASCVPTDRMDDWTMGDSNAFSMKPGSSAAVRASGSHAGGVRTAAEPRRPGAGSGSAIRAVSRS